jgi:phosphatidate cytidylyltransferase
MLKTRVLTAVILVPLVLAALFGLDTRAWGVLTLAIVGIAASEWARLAAFPATGSTVFVLGTLAIGLLLLFLPGFGFATGSGWPELVVLSVCGAARCSGW